MNMKNLPKGTYTPLVTPFTTTGNVDFSALEGLVERQLAAGIEALVVLGTTGESPTVSQQEFVEITRFIVDLVKSQSTVLACIGNNNTTVSIDTAKQAEQLGVDGLLVLCPYYSKPTQTGLLQHFAAIAESIPLPQLVYNIEGRTGINVETQTLMELAQIPNIVGVKEASADIEQISAVIAATQDDFLVLSGCDHLNYPLLSLGGHGVISTLANLVPIQVKSLVDHALADNYIAARQLHYQLMPLAHGCFIEANPIPVKTALAILGLIDEQFRLPITNMSQANKDKWQTTLIDHGIITKPLSEVSNG